MDILVRDINQYISPILPVKLNISSARERALQRKFASFVALRYRQMVQEAVYQQLYAYTWKPLNKAYKEHKIRTGLNPDIWIATSTLIDSIVVVRKSTTLEVGVDKRKVNPESHTKLSLIVKALEFGAGSIPPRPLFTPVYKSIVRSMPQLFAEFLREGAKGFESSTFEARA